jgi:hypothetical protein
MLLQYRYSLFTVAEVSHGLPVPDHEVYVTRALAVQRLYDMLSERAGGACYEQSHSRSTFLQAAGARKCSTSHFDSGMDAMIAKM